jgi:hypothetical protein
VDRDWNDSQPIYRQLHARIVAMILEGVLIMRSGFIPRWLSYPLFAAGTGHVINSLGGLLPPLIRGITQCGQVLGVGELPFSSYLLIRGVRRFVVDRLAALLFLVHFAIGTPALVLLLRDRIDATQYAALALASLAALVGMAMRWKQADSTTAEART